MHVNAKSAELVSENKKNTGKVGNQGAEKRGNGPVTKEANEERELQCCQPDEACAVEPSGLDVVQFRRDLLRSDRVAR